MKQLICASHVEEFAKNGSKTYYVESGAIITPAARDAAKRLDIVFAEGAQPSADSKAGTGCDANFDLAPEMIYKVLKAIIDSGMPDCAMPSAPYISESGSGGLKLVRGNTVKMDYFDTGNPSNKVYFQELIGKDDSSMSAGFLTIDHSSFDWELSYEEIDIVLDGTLEVKLDGRTFTAKKGDVLYVPKGSKVTWSSPDCARLFYVTYPANWPDLM